MAKYRVRIVYNVLRDKVEAATETDYWRFNTQDEANAAVEQLTASEADRVTVKTADGLAVMSPKYLVTARVEKVSPQVIPIEIRTPRRIKDRP